MRDDYIDHGHNDAGQKGTDDHNPGISLDLPALRREGAIGGAGAMVCRIRDQLLQDAKKSRDGDAMGVERTINGRESEECVKGMVKP